VLGGRAEARPLLLSFKGTVGGPSRWGFSRVLAVENSHDAAHAVFLSATGERPIGKTGHVMCGATVQAN
jgi:hypothetical protein